MASDSNWVVAVSGGVAAGKSAVTRRFEALGVAVYDADLAARAVVDVGTPGLAAIAAAFGAEVLLDDGALDRRAMRERVFADDAARERLQDIVHPLIRACLRAQVYADRGAYCMLAIPLLAETWPQYAWVDRVLIVDAPDAVRIQRLLRRDGITPVQAQRMLSAQATRAARLALADDVIDNDADEAALDAVVAALHQRYLALAAGSVCR